MKPLPRRRSKSSSITKAALVKENEQLRRALADAAEQQTATSEILRVISSSPTDVQPVFDAIIQSAVRLCGAHLGALVRVDGNQIHLAALLSATPEGAEAVRRAFPIPLDSSSRFGRSIVEQRIIHVPDVEDQAAMPGLTDLARAVGFRSQLTVPMLRNGQPIGAIRVARAEPGPFADDQIQVLRIFADQAVIAIENVRLFTELQQKNRGLADAHAQVSEALEQQTATSEILRVISRSPTDVQPVFDAIARSAAVLCGASAGAVFRLDGDLIDLVAHHSGTPEWLAVMRRMYPAKARERLPGRAALERAILHFADVENDPRTTPELLQGARVFGFRRALFVPMHQEGAALGAIAVVRPEPGPFSDRHIELIKTFADQAVIAIENVRLFKELEARNRDLTEALDRQTATAEILRIISQSPTDVQPVFDSIVRSAKRLCKGTGATLFHFDGTLIHVVALDYDTPAHFEAFRQVFPMRLDTPSAIVRTIADRRVVHIADIDAEPDVPAFSRDSARQFDYRSLLLVPMLRDGTPVGAIGVNRKEAVAFSDSEIELLKTFADQAVIAIENVRLFKELQARNRDLTATSEILQVISSSPTDVQPVFDAIVQSAVRLCNGQFGGVFRFDGELLHLAAHHNWTKEALEASRRAYPTPPSRQTPPARAILDRNVVHIPNVDLDNDISPEDRALAHTVGARSFLSVPMLKDGNPVGAVTIARAIVGLFSDSEIGLLKTFADQAVIAIENVRLFTELEARNRDLTTALDRQTATADVLRIIAQSPTDLQPVLDAIATSAVRLCAASDAVIERLEGDRFYNAAHAGAQMKGLVGLPLPLTRRFPGGRAILDRKPVILDDIHLVAEREYPDTLELLKLNTIHSVAEIPLLSEGKPLGCLAVLRAEVRPFTDAEVSLLETFADQAVIAIENVRLFKELEERNREVTEALEQQTATSEILGVISSSPTDVQPVFDTIVARAARLCDATHASIYRVDGDALRHMAMYGAAVGGGRRVGVGGTAPLNRGSGPGRAVLTGRTVHVLDSHRDPELSDELRPIVLQDNVRTVLTVPLLREGTAIGAILIRRTQVRAFTDKEIQLLETFANQAVIAIENVRLFSELEARTQELTRSVAELTALGDVSRALSSTLNLETVLQTIVTRANQLAGTAGCTIWEYDEGREEFRLRVSHYADERDAAILQAPDRVTTIRRGQGVTTRVVELRQPVQILDITAEGAYDSPIRRPLLDAGHRALLGVPLLREEQVIGVLAVTRKTPGEFAPEVVQLLTTFATQSALAIQNARLFREIEQKSRELEAASRHKSEFLASMSHELRTPLNAIIGFSDVLLDKMFGEINEKQTEYLQDILSSGKHLLSLINDILDLSKIEAGRMELDLSDFDLPQAIDDALMLMRERASRRAISLDRLVDERLGHIRADERKIKQVLLNLLSNAVKFTPEGGRIDVRAGISDGLAEISVTDTGIGIAPEDQASVFEEFRQVGSAAKKVEGTGLGLALCRKFVELHGGRIWVKSQVGVGSTFTFTIPVRRGE